ncbi:hypothetical protein [Pontiella sp.]|uniref:hypothetical protein n=1 Tax=Pontiella sp. TaxID=2837462 RepID=UPI0035659209
MNTKKRNWLVLLCIGTAFMAFGRLTDRQLRQFESEVEIAGVRMDTYRSNKDRKRFERLEINTFQSEDDIDNYDMTRFRMRIVAELTDRDKHTYLIQFDGRAPGDRDSEYTGEDYWNLFIAHGDFERLKVTAHYIQYGIMDGDKFVVLAEDKNKVDEMLGRVRDRTTVLFPGTVYLRHYYIYNDAGLGTSESNPVNIRRLNE